MAHSVMLDDEYENLRRNLNALRSELGFSHEDLADASGISKHTLRSWEYGYCRPGNEKALEPVAKALGTTTRTLLGPGKVIARAIMQPEDIENVYPMNVLRAALCYLTDEEKEDDTPVYSLYDYSLKAFMDELHKKTSTKQLRIIEYRYRDGLTLEKTGQLVNLSRDRCRQIQNIVLAKLHRSLMNGRLNIHTHAEIEELQKRLDEAEKTIEKLTAEKEALCKLVNGNYSEDNTPAMVMQTKVRENDPIDTLDLSVRTWNCMRRAGIYTIKSLLECKDPFRLRNFGKGCCRDVIECLDKNRIDYRNTIWYALRFQTLNDSI